MRKLFYALLLIGCAGAVLAQQFATSFKSVEVSPGIYMLDGVDGFGGGSVRLLVGDDYVVLIDDAMTPTVIIPGHGPVASKADLETNFNMLIDAEMRVKALVDKGLNEDDIVAANPLALYLDDYNWGFITTERMTRTLIRSLTGK